MVSQETVMVNFESNNGKFFMLNLNKNENEHPNYSIYTKNMFFLNIFHKISRFFKVLKIKNDSIYELI